VNHSFSTGISKSWSAGGPKELWRVETLGGGFSLLFIYGDKMYTLGDHGDTCNVIAMDCATGKEIWKVALAKSGDGGGRHIGPFATPACDGETVYAYGQFGDFAAFDAKDGKERWRKNIPGDLGGGKMSIWGFSPSPILDGDKILLPIGGDGGTLGAFDKTGKLLWRTAQITDLAAYTSVVPTTIGGVKQYMLLTGSTLAGISPTDGKTLWEAEFPGQTAVCSDPVLCGDVIMASCHYRVGAYFYRIAKEGNGFKATKTNDDGLQNLISHHGGIVSVGDHFYLLTNRELACVDAKTGNIVWTNESVGKGSLIYVDGKLIVRGEKDAGTIALVEATPSGYKELGKFDQPERSNANSWTYPVVVDKKLYIRDQGLLLCYDLN
jgi:outer membrane protein assembly factor BamB